MPNLLLDYALTAVPLAIIAWVCVYITRPFFEKKWTRILSQVVAVILLFVAFILSKGMAEDETIRDVDAGILLPLAIGYFAIKSIAIYLIGCYAKSVGKSPYWAFLGVLNFLLAFPLLIFGLWKTKKPNALSHEEMVEGLRKMVDDPATPTEKRDWAENRLGALEQKKA